MLVDTHAHLVAEAFAADRDQVIDRARQAGVGAIVCIGDHLAASAAAAQLAAARSEVWAAVGIHPHHAGSAPEDVAAALRPLCHQPRVVAIGEIGLDYHYDFAPRDQQMRVFRAQLRLARELGLPVVVHNRKADQDVLQALREECAGDVGGVLHCFWSDWETAAAALDLGFYLGIGGPITFKRSDDLRALVKRLPLGRLLVETDAPYLAPTPHRGRRNEPAFVALTAAALAEVKGLSFAEVAAATTHNAARLFRLPLHNVSDVVSLS